ncbi:MAG: hypothetical protein IKX00_03795 [Bacilli bacterium]|nr:hypothetical protein [Bacilli bacterium]
MRNPLTRLFYIGVLGLGISFAIAFDNYFSKSNTLWEYIISIILAAFSAFFILESILIGKKKKKK